MDKVDKLIFYGILLVLPQIACGSWWLLNRLQVSSLGAVSGCKAQARDLCRADLLAAAGRGVANAVGECQTQFRRHRWNCSTLEAGAALFPSRMLAAANRESAFLAAISSAGVAHALARACSRGEITAGCPCDIGRRPCSHVYTGLRFARRIVDDALSDASALLRRHNNRAGRKAILRSGTVRCKCHGVSGSCGTRTCWSVLGELGGAGRWLRARWEEAVRVSWDQRRGRLVPASRKAGRFTQEDLVYFESSPDYCQPNRTLGTLGTGGRECWTECGSLCCGRGHDLRRQASLERCGCRFDWCCKVRCKFCRRWTEIRTCRHPV